jgi:hypothetical protein
MDMLMNDIHHPNGDAESAGNDTYRTLLAWLQQYGFADAESFLVEHPTELIAAAIAHVQRAPAGSVRNPGGLIRSMVKTGAVPQIVYGIREVPVSSSPAGDSGPAGPSGHPYQASPDGLGCQRCGMPESNRRHRGSSASIPVEPAMPEVSGPSGSAGTGLRSLAAVMGAGSTLGDQAVPPRPSEAFPESSDPPGAAVVRLTPDDIPPLREAANSQADPMERIRRLLFERSGNLLADEAG